jgi:hypothetical protein
MIAPHQPGCALCWIDGVWSKPIDNWPGFPICREHIAESMARTSGQPALSCIASVKPPLALQ